MNTIYSLKYLGLFLFSACILLSCKKPADSVGLGLLPSEEQLAANQSDTVKMVFTTEINDSVYTDESALQLIGADIDPVFGSVRASIFTQFTPSTYSPSFPTSFEIDSVVLSLAYHGYQYGKLTPQLFEVHELTESMYFDSSYFAFRTLQANPENLVYFSDVGSPFKEIMMNINDSLYLGTDSLGVKPQLRLPLQKELGERILTAAPENLANAAGFLNFFKGIEISTASPLGGIAAIDLLDAATKIRIYYRDTGSEPDTSFYDLAVNSTNARFTHYHHGFANGGGELSPLAYARSFVDNQFGYLQSAAGTRLRIKFPHIKNWNLTGLKTVNKAEVILPFVPDLVYGPPQLLFAFYRDTDGKLKEVPDYNTYAYPVGGNRDIGLVQYRLNISRFIQKVVYGSIATNELYVFAVNPTYSSNRVVLKGPEYPGTNRYEQARLVLTYSE